MWSSQDLHTVKLQPRFGFIKAAKFWGTDAVGRSVESKCIPVTAGQWTTWITVQNGSNLYIQEYKAADCRSGGTGFKRFTVPGRDKLTFYWITY
jgi:hypothetical protein